MNHRITILVWGSCDLGKPRMRIILSALASSGVDVKICRIGVWDDVRDKSRIVGTRARLRYFFRYVWSLPRLCLMYLKAPPHDVVLIGYLGHFDVLVFRPIAWLFRKPVVWDAFLSLYDTIVIDRSLLRPGGIGARMIRWIEKLSCRAADQVVLDTQAHVQRFVELLDCPKDRITSIPVGVEPEIFPQLDTKPLSADEPLIILFYGQFIPLHGIETIIEAAKLSSDRNWRWRLIGTGQEAQKLESILDERLLSNIDWTTWVPYENLSNEIAAADLCLGIFGKSSKAASVVPNKVYQVIASGRPLVTRDSPAMRELVSSPIPGLILTPPANPKALVGAIAKLETLLRRSAFDPNEYDVLRRRFALSHIGAQWNTVLAETVSGKALKSRQTS